MYYQLGYKTSDVSNITLAYLLIKGSMNMDGINTLQRWRDNSVPERQ
jgi:hypothetical protein